MNAGAVRNSSNYYSNSYDVTPAGEELQTLEDLQAEIDGDATWSEDPAAFDSYSDETAALESGFSLKALIEELRRQEAELQAQLEAQPQHEAAQAALHSLQFFIKRLIPLGDVAELPGYLKDEYLLIQAELGEAQLQLQTSAQIAGPLDRIARLNAGLESALEGVDLDPELRQEMEALLPQLGKAKGSLELATNPETAAQTEESLEELLNRAEEIFAAYQEEHASQREQIQADIQSLEDSLQTSEARGYYRLKVAKKLIELKSQFEAGSLPLEEVAQGLKDLGTELQEGVKKTAEEKQEK
ncbi:hypothetical protein F9K50_12670, partial [bacterium]